MSKTKALSGFVYIWYDRKHKRYYIGSHWGTENDGYICSSRWMRKTYNRRPQDFKRRILSIIETNRVDLLIEEDRWLSMIKPKEVSIRYYNQRLSTFSAWHTYDEKRKIIGEKISNTNKGRKQTFSDPIERNRKISEGKKKAFEQRILETGSAFSNDHVEKLSKAKLGRKHTEEWKTQNSENLREQWASGKRKPNIGKYHTEESKLKMRKSQLGKSHTSETKEKLSIRKTFSIDNQIFENMTRLEICNYINIPEGSYYHQIKTGKIKILE